MTCLMENCYNNQPNWIEMRENIDQNLSHNPFESDDITSINLSRITSSVQTYMVSLKSNMSEPIYSETN